MTGKALDLQAIRTFVFDVDGVMTDGRVTVTEAGELLRTMNIKDGYALKRAVDAGYRVVVITGGRSEGVRKRFARIGINDYYSGVHDKVEVLRAYAERHQCDLAQAVYAGDDLPDVPAMLICGNSVVPSDAVQEVREAATEVSDRAGGDAFVRQLIERVMRAQGKWTLA